MSLKKISKNQPDNFKFDSKNLEEAEKIITNYPKGKQKSAVMALLYIAQKQYLKNLIQQEHQPTYVL